MILTWSLDQQLNFTRKTKQRQKRKLTITSCQKIDIVVIFWIFGQFGAVWRPDSDHRVCRSCVFSNSNLWSYKNWIQNYKIFNTALTLLPRVMVLSRTKTTNFSQKKFWHQQNQGGQSTKRYIFWNYIWMCTYVPNLKFLA